MGQIVFDAALQAVETVAKGGNTVFKIAEFAPSVPVEIYAAGEAVGTPIGGLVIGSEGVGAAAAVLGAGIGAVGAGLSAPVSAPVIGGGILLGAIIGAAIGYFTQPAAGSAAATYTGSTGGGNGTYGDNTKTYNIVWPISNSGNAPALLNVPGPIGDVAPEYIPGVSTPGNAGFVLFHSTNGGTKINDGLWFYPSPSSNPVPTITLASNNAVVGQNGAVTGVAFTPSPLQNFNREVGRIAPALSPSQPVPTRAPVPNPVKPANKPNAPDLPGIKAPQTGRTATPFPKGGGGWTLDPNIPKENTPSNPVPKEKNKEREVGLIVPTLPVTCPSPCPDLDLSEVLAKIAEVKQELDLVEDRIGFVAPSDVLQCGQVSSVPSVQSYFEAVDLKLGFNLPLDVPEGTNNDEDVCDLSTALESVLSVVPSVTVVQGFEVKALRNGCLLIYFNVDQKVIKARVSMRIPNPIAGLTKASILAAVGNRIPGDWLVSLGFDDSTEIKGWFASEAAGRAYLTAVAPLANLTFDPDTAFTATHRPGKGTSLPAGTVVYPVCAYLVDGGGQANISNRFVLTT